MVYQEGQKHQNGSTPTKRVSLGEFRNTGWVHRTLCRHVRGGEKFDPRTITILILSNAPGALQFAKRERY